MALAQMRAACGLSFALLLAACAAPVPVTPARLAPLQGPVAEMVIPSPIDIPLSTGYVRTLAAQSRWRSIGVLPQGTVYQPVGTAFAIEGRQVHEAYLVVRGGSLQGFYLPAESNYSPLARPIPLSISTGGQR